MFAATQLSANNFLTREFFARDTTTVARELIGCRLFRRVRDRFIVATLVEVEAYLGQSDPASHAFRGPTKRNQVMFGPPGHLYVYFSYGMHHCANVVTEAEGVAGAVLLRAAQVESGIDVVRENRATMLGDHQLLRGPGNLAKGLAIGRDDYGTDFCDSSAELRILAPEAAREIAIQAGPRVGISKAVDLPLRFWWSGHMAVSAGSRRRE